MWCWLQAAAAASEVAQICYIFISSFSPIHRDWRLLAPFCHPGEGRAEAVAPLALPAPEDRASLPAGWLCCSHGHVLHVSPASAFLVARVGPSVPRQDRPVREGTRVASIETGLAAAAAKLSQQVRLLEKLKAPSPCSRTVPPKEQCSASPPRCPFMPVTRENIGLKVR